MKSKNLHNAVLSKCDTSTRIYHDLSGVIGLRTIKRRCQTSTISLSSPPGCSRLVRTKANIKTVKDRLRR